ncbi:MULTISPECIES: hypothetical protein [Luteibacter]|uniref:hypothetical protein n=1 Tax=Luteibacter sp. dw_328 TaxID=2719796 RepID=UPI0007BF252B|nr:MULTISPECIES: hypothetical protein [Luteibacter]
MGFPKFSNKGRDTGRQIRTQARSTIIDFNSLSPGEWAEGSVHADLAPGVTAYVLPEGPFAVLRVGTDKPYVSGIALGNTSVYAAGLALVFDKPYRQVKFGAHWGHPHQEMPNFLYSPEKIADPEYHDNWKDGVSPPIQHPGQSVGIVPDEDEKIWGIILWVFDGELIDNFELIL